MRRPVPARASPQTDHALPGHGWTTKIRPKSGVTEGGNGYQAHSMDHLERPDRRNDGLWHETLSSLVLVAGTLFLVFLISLFGRV